MQRDQALRILSENLPELREIFGVQWIALFGSTARDSAGKGSDVDILVEFDHPFGLFHLSRTKFFLEEVLGGPVDLIPGNAIIPELRDPILGEAVDVW